MKRVPPPVEEAKAENCKTYKFDDRAVSEYIYTLYVLGERARERQRGCVRPLGAGAGDRGRTGTVLLPSDFESDTSANSITPALLEYYTTMLRICQHFKFNRSKNSAPVL